MFREKRPDVKVYVRLLGRDMDTFNSIEKMKKTAPVVKETQADWWTEMEEEKGWRVLAKALDTYNKLEQTVETSLHAGAADKTKLEPGTFFA